jgi:uncharacterized protein
VRKHFDQSLGRESLLKAITARVASLRTLPASRHRKTGRVFFPPMPENSPLADEYEAVALSREAKLYSFTIVHPGPKTGKPPFALAYADFPELVRVLGRLEFDETPVIGAALSVEVDEGLEGTAPSYRFILKG